MSQASVKASIETGNLPLNIRKSLTVTKSAKKILPIFIGYPK